MRIAVIGCGVVGGAVADGLERLGHEIFRHDPARFGTTIPDVVEFEPRIAFVCVPTPQLDTGECDTSIVESVVHELVDSMYAGIIAIKSTVTPGTCDHLREKYDANIAFVPEFLREKSAFHDFTEGHDICVVGANGLWRESMYRDIAIAHGHYPKKFFYMSTREAELVKYFSNVYNAMRVVFANGFFDVCKKLGADYNKVKEAAVARPTIEDKYLDCNDNFRGFAGVCLPKDTAAFAWLADSLGVDCGIFDTIVEDNKLYKPTVFDGMRME